MDHTYLSHIHHLGFHSECVRDEEPAIKALPYSFLLSPEYWKDMKS